GARRACGALGFAGCPGGVGPRRAPSARPRRFFGRGGWGGPRGRGGLGAPPRGGGGGGGGPRPAIIVSERCVDTWKSGWQRYLDRRLASRTTRLIANSQPVADFYRDTGFPAERTVVIPNGVEVAEPESFDRAARLAEFGLPADAAVVGYVGRLARQKRVDDLLWALQMLRQIAPRPTWMLVVGDGRERRRLERIARQVECADRVRFVGHRADTRGLMPLFDVFWLASDFEGLSNSLMEAMAAGVPVVASDIPPNRELVVDGETGFLVRVGDSAGFTQFTDRILADAVLARRLGEAGRRRMREEFSVERMVARHIDLYREICGHRHR
ncbi:MAG: glycosyltransferase, partial [Planctomycetes bacterium]|nr:glycosyltransferase [Planctomycetota bacterium]